ncbi:SPOR domain-containing protein [Bacteroidota bacterium]
MPSYSQDVDIIPYLKRIENGHADEVKLELTHLKIENPGNPDIMFLEGVLTENGQKAVLIYQTIVDDYPESKYADAALYRIYTYYYALGLYESAEKKLGELNNNYPESPYIKIARQNQLPANPEITREENVTETNKVDDDQLVNKFTIQAGAFSIKENAEKLRLEFEKSGLYSEVTIKLVGGTTFHIVYVGKFISENDAEDFLITINDKFELTGRVTTIQR